MNLVSFYRKNRTDVESKLSQISFWKKAVFGLLCCERAIPNYNYYSNSEQFGTPELLKEVMNNCWNSVLTQQLEVSQTQMEEYLQRLNTDEVTPDSSESIYADAAQDVVIVVYDIVRFLLQKEEKFIADITMTCIETVEKYIFDTYGDVEDNDSEYDEKMLSFSELSQEMSIQSQQLDSLQVNEVSQQLVEQLRAYHNGDKSNIGLS